MGDPRDVEPLLPKVSLRWLIGLVTVCSLSMAVVQQAVVNLQTWAVLGSVVIASLVLPILLYVGTFSLASFFATIGSAVVGPSSPERQYAPTAEMPADQDFSPPPADGMPT